MALPTDAFPSIRGTLQPVFRVGKESDVFSVQLAKNAGVLEVRDAAGTNFAPGTALSLSLSDALGGTSLFFDSADGQTAPVSAIGHARIRYSNGTVQWEQSVNGAAYTPFGGGGSANGLVEVRIPFAGATVDSVAVLPAGARVSLARVETDGAYTPGTTITVGQPAAPASFVTAAQNKPAVAATYLLDIDEVALVDVVRVTLGGPIGPGSGVAIVYYAVPAV